MTLSNKLKNVILIDLWENFEVKIWARFDGKWKFQIKFKQNDKNK